MVSLSLADSEIKGEVLYLGYYQSAFDWDDETAKVAGVWDWEGRVAGFRLKALTRRGGSGLAAMFLRAWWPFFLLSLFLTSSLSCLMSSPGLQAASPETLPQPDLWQWVQVRPQWEAPGG